MPSTLTHGLLPPACVLYGKKTPLSRRENLKLFFASAVIANLPDLDVIPAALNPTHWKQIHRSYGHNMFALGIWMILGYWLLRRWGWPSISDRAAKFYAVGLVLSHVLLDSLGGPNAMGARIGVPLLYPLSHWEFLLPVILFRGYHIRPGVNPLIGHVTSAQFWTDSIFSEAIGTVVLFTIWVVGVRIASRLRRRQVKVNLKINLNLGP